MWNFEMENVKEAVNSTCHTQSGCVSVFVCRNMACYNLNTEG